MRLMNFTDFGLRALILLARSDGAPMSAAAIADHFGVSRHHMAKVLHRLSADGFVESLRGPNGGVRLAREPREIVIGEVVRRLEGEDAIVQCRSDDGRACRLLDACLLPVILGRAKDRFLKELDSYSLADCLGRRV